MDVDAVLAPLRDAGLIYAYDEFRGNIHVHGGRHEWNVTAGPFKARVQGWEDPFMIYGKPDKLMVVVAAVQTHPWDEEQECSSLEEAVRFVLQVYAGRV